MTDRPMNGASASPGFPVRFLGQSGCRIAFPGTTVYCDPYLSDSVRELDAPDLERLVPAPFRPEEVADADWVLVTHDHLDHCDPHTLPALAAASPGCRFLGPEPALALLESWGIDKQRLHPAEEDWTRLGDEVRVRAVPAAHPEVVRTSSGRLVCAGYFLECRDRTVYLAGDTFARQEVLDALHGLPRPDLAVLPVNEHNFFRQRRGILGNMSVREAFAFAEEIGARRVLPAHWDMFAANAVSWAEIALLYDLLKPGFELVPPTR